MKLNLGTVSHKNYSICNEHLTYSEGYFWSSKKGGGIYKAAFSCPVLIMNMIGSYFAGKISSQEVVDIFL